MLLEPGSVCTSRAKSLWRMAESLPWLTPASGRLRSDCPYQWPQARLRLSNCRLLIVDDEPALRRALRTSLTGPDFEVSEARSGEEALVLLGQTPSDLVLLD